MLFAGRMVSPVLWPCFPADALDGHLLAVGDEDGLVRLLDTRKRATHSQFVRKGTCMYMCGVLCSVSHLWCEHLHSLLFPPEIPAHNSPVFDLAWIPGTNQIVSVLTAMVAV